MHQIKLKILYFYHIFTQINVYNPKDIADAFSSFYSLLYNLKDDGSIFQPSYTEIDNFQASINLPNLTFSRHQALNAPFVYSKFIKNVDIKKKWPGPDGIAR